MKKKLLRHLFGVSALSILPIVAVTSCGSNQPVILNIKAKSVTQEIIDEAIVIWNANNELSTDEARDKILKALQTVFSGVDKDNLNKFTCYAKPTTGPELGYIELTSKSDYIFDSGNKLKSTSV